MTQTYSKEFADNLYDQTFQVWANPEIARRQKLGSLPEEFSPWAVQVLMDPEYQPTVVKSLADEEQRVLLLSSSD